MHTKVSLEENLVNCLCKKLMQILVVRWSTAYLLHSFIFAEQSTSHKFSVLLRELTVLLYAGFKKVIEDCLSGGFLYYYFYKVLFSLYLFYNLPF